MPLVCRLFRNHSVYRWMKGRDVKRRIVLGFFSRYTWALILLAAVLYNEWIVYRICYTFKWKEERIHSEMPADQLLRILLVADPQIQGYRDESQSIGFLSRWDADRYLAAGYGYALAFTKPDLVVFLGDLTDEGSRTTSEVEYKEYVARFRKIFLDQTPQETLLLPGDNDVGGEGFDVKSIDKVLRFEKHFSRTQQLVSKKFVDFFMLDYTKTDLFTSSRIERTKSQLREMQRNRLKPFSVVLNHENILSVAPVFYNPIFEASRPNLLLTAHAHRAFVMRCLRCWDSHGGVLEYVRKPGRPFDTFYFSLSTADVDGVFELAVPTCSYRMGVPDMAYGFLTLTKDGAGAYTNLWLPSRFYCLYLYLVALGLSLVSFFCHTVRTRAVGRLWRL